MSQADSASTSLNPVLEVHGSFPDYAALHAAIEALRSAGYVHADSRMPDASRGGNDPEPTEEDRQQMRVLTTSLAGSVGGLLAGLAVLATGAAIPLVAGAVLAGAVGSGALAEGVDHEIEKKQTDADDSRGGFGKLKLAMRVPDQAHADEVTRIMRESGATDIQTVSNAADAVVQGVSASAWTG